jgi:hypothetical protein
MEDTGIAEGAFDEGSAQLRQQLMIHRLPILSASAIIG